jgi:rhodanese-related sulfurtransferase
MKVKISILFIMLAMAATAIAQNPVNWSKSQLLEPAALAQSIKANKKLPKIFSIGPGATIPTSVQIGMVNEQAGLDKLKAELKGLDKKTSIVIYCGCCPFEHCPNARPAIAALKEMNFTNYKLLNLPHNMKTDWIDQGYPTARQ